MATFVLILTLIFQSYSSLSLLDIDSQTEFHSNEFRESNQTDIQSLWSLILIHEYLSNNKPKSIEIFNSIITEYNSLISYEQIVKESYDFTNFLELAVLYVTSVDDISEIDGQSFRIDLTKNQSELLTKLTNKENIDFETFNNQSDLIKYFIIYSRNRYNYLEDGARDQIILTHCDSDSYLLDLICIKASYDTYRYKTIAQLDVEIIQLEKIPTSNDLIRILSIYTYSLSEVGLYYRANEIIKNYQLPIAQKYFDKDDIDRQNFRYANNLSNLGVYNKAELLYKRLSKSSTLNKSSINNNLGLVYYKLGKFDKYTSLQLKSIELAIESESYFDIINGYRNLHIYHKYNRNWESALNYLQEAEKLAIDQFESELSPIYRSYGDFYWESEKDFDKALLFLNKALGLISVEDYSDYTNILSLKAKLFEESELFEDAIIQNEQVIEIASNQGDNRKYIETLIDISVIKLKAEDITGSKDELERIKNYDYSTIDFISLVKLKYLESFHDLDKLAAIDNLKELSSTIIERAKASTNSQAGYWNIEKEYLEVFELLADLFIENDAMEEAIDLFEQVKTINDANFYNNPLITANQLDEQDLNRVKDINSELSDLREKLLSATGGQKTSVQSSIDAITAEKELILAKSGREIKNKRLQIWNIQNRLDTDQTLIHFTELNDNLYKSTVTRSGIEIEKKSFGEDEKELFDRAAISLADRKTNLFDLYSISEFLSITDLPNTTSEIYLIPDSYLFRIPLDALPVTEPETEYAYGQTRYLIEDFPVITYSTLTEFSINSRNHYARHRIDFNAYGISDFGHIQSKELVPLPFASKEVAALNESFQHLQRNKVLTNENALKSSFISDMTQSKIVHLATHSEVSNQNPLYSTMYFHSDDTTGSDDGTMYAYELYNLDIDSDLIFLNSCSSGSGNYMQGTGIMGINRALRYAGAKSLILNLWPVNDNIAADFAKNFYANLENGLTKSEALRQAKINQLQNGSADPHYWGVYMLVGNHMPVIKKPYAAGAYGYLLIIFSFLLSAVLYRRYKS